MNILIIIFILILILILYFTYEGKYNTKYKPSLKHDGFIFLNSQNKDNVLKHLPKGYQFINYKYTIHGCTLSTFHRDVTSSQYIYKTKYPTYTFITYKHQGSGLSVCPGSHKTTPLLFTHPINVNYKNSLKIKNPDFIWLNFSQIKKLNLKKGVLNPFVKTILFMI